MIIAKSSSIAIIPETKQMNLNMGRYLASWGCSLISIYAMRWTIVAMKKGKMIAKCVWSGETLKTWKCIPIKPVGYKARSPRIAWNASMKKSASLLAHTQTRNPLALILIFLPNIGNQNPLNFHTKICTPLGRWSLHKYKCLWSVGVRARIQVSGRELHTHIHLD